MAKIKKTISGLNPDSNYLFTLKPKNVEISALDELPEAIRVKTPSAVGNPSNITGLTLAANFETVMFAFDPVNDIDLDYFEYRLYDNSAGTGTLVNQKTATNGDLISGTAKANVFTVSVENSTSSVNTAYWGTVRTVSTAGTRGAWVYPLVGSGDTPLIQDQYINNLTASKITSGTIGAHTITLAGATSIIKSSNYSTGSEGWKIDGVGNAEFNQLTIRSQLDIGGDDTSSFHVDIDGNMWLGAAVANKATAPFRVSNTGNFFAGTGTKFIQWDGANLTTTGQVITNATQTGGTIAGINAGTNKIYIGTGNYANADTAFYVDSSGNFSLKNKLYWNATTNELVIDGTVTIGSRTASQVNSSIDTAQNTANGKVSPGDVKNNLGGTGVTTISGGVITTGTINLNSVNVNTGTSGARLSIDSTGIKIYNTGGVNTVALNSDGSAVFQRFFTRSNRNIPWISINWFW